MRILLALIVGILFANPVQAEPPAGKLRFIFICPFVDYDFFQPVKQGMRAAAQALDVECTFAGVKDGDVKALAAMVRQAAQDGYSGIAVNIIDPVAFDAAIAAAVAHGVPVVAFNVDDQRTPNARLAAVCQNLLEAGRTLGKEAAAFVPDHSKILMTMHDAGVSALEDRLHGAQEVLRARGVTWVQLITGTDREKAVEKIRAALAAQPEIKIVLATGKADTEAAGLAIERHFAGKGYAVAGFDLCPETLRLVQAGIIRFTIDQQPYLQGYYPVVQLALLRRYGIKPTNIDAGASLITKDNVAAVIELSRQHFR
jgi:simple sugar transport system substrate-binding protein